MDSDSLAKLYKKCIFEERGNNHCLWDLSDISWFQTEAMVYALDNEEGQYTQLSKVICPAASYIPSHNCVTAESHGISSITNCP